MQQHVKKIVQLVILLHSLDAVNAWKDTHLLFAVSVFLGISDWGINVLVSDMSIF